MKKTDGDSYPLQNLPVTVLIGTRLFVYVQVMCINSYMLYANATEDSRMMIAN